MASKSSLLRGNRSNSDGARTEGAREGLSPRNLLAWRLFCPSRDDRRYLTAGLCGH